MLQENSDHCVHCRNNTLVQQQSRTRRRKEGRTTEKGRKGRAIFKDSSPRDCSANTPVYLEGKSSFCRVSKRHHEVIRIKYSVLGGFAYAASQVVPASTLASQAHAVNTIQSACTTSCFVAEAIPHEPYNFFCVSTAWTWTGHSSNKLRPSQKE